MTFVLDNSVTMRWLFRDGSDGDREYADLVLEALCNTNCRVPMPWGLEVANVVAQSEARGILPMLTSTRFLDKLRGLRIEADSETFQQSFTGTLAVAREYRLSAYDASYLELALRLCVPLATLDLGLRKAAKKAGVELFALN